MDPGRKFSAGTLIYAWRHAPFPPGSPQPPPPRPPPPPIYDTPPSVVDGEPEAVNARLPPLSPPLPLPLPRPPPPPRMPGRFHMSEVAVGVVLGFGAAVLLLIVVCLFVWTSRRKRRMLASLCKGAPVDKSKGK